jgi:hypothetical protein
MRTPAGKECKHYYEDYNRGRNIKECRLVKDNPDSLPWRPSDCARCPVPDILNANASPDMVLTLRLDNRLLGLRRAYTVTATCIKHDISIDDPYVGCPHCNAERPGLDLFRKALGDSDHD